MFAQIGLIMLIGLSAKNAILIVEFARTRYEHGVPLLEAALQGAKVRLRPILMTSFAFIFGCVPLWLASGSGAVARKVMGTTVIGGMLAASGLAIFLIPVTFYVIEMWATKGLPHSAHATALHPVAEHPEFRPGEAQPGTARTDCRMTPTPKSALALLAAPCLRGMRDRARLQAARRRRAVRLPGPGRARSTDRSPTSRGGTSTGTPG